MRETEAEVAELQRMFDAHLEHANPHMTGIITPERRLTARQVVRDLEGIKHVAFATVTSRGEPRVIGLRNYIESGIPLDAALTYDLPPRFTVSTGGGATRLKHLRANPACSAVHMDGERIAVVANGTVEWIGRDHPDHHEIHGIWQATYESDPYDWGDGVVLFRIAPTSMWAYASHPEEFPE